MTIFFYLLLGHFVADYPLQTRFLAMHKNRNLPNPTGVPWYYVLTAHAATHAAAVAFVTGNPWLALIELVLHWWIDSCKFEGDFNIHIDQALHVLCKAGFAAWIFWMV
jgi:hypothetical protein